MTANDCIAEIERLNRLLSDAQRIISEYKARAIEVARTGAQTVPEPVAYRETVGKVAAAREKGYAAARANLQEAWAALAMIRETTEALAPSGSVKASEHLDGPTFMHEADALVAGITAIASSPPAPLPAGGNKK